jgi:hypothetical protein
MHPFAGEQAGTLKVRMSLKSEPIFDRNSHQFQREAGKRRSEKGTILQVKSEPTFTIGINDK